MTFYASREAATSKSRPNVGISACLMGDPVRYNGGHCHSKFCTETLSTHIDFTPFCPEVAAGFGTPRPTMRLMRDPETPILTYNDGSRKDLTGKLIEGCDSFLFHIRNLDGYILMKNSPSCGLERIKVFQTSGYPHQARGQGIFTSEMQKRYPYLPLEEEGRLNDPKLRENFLMRVFALHEFKKSVLPSKQISALIAFHSRYKYLIMAHSTVLLKTLGQLVANQDNIELGTLKSLYLSRFMFGISKPTTKKRNSNVLLHIAGYLRKFTSSNYRRQIAEAIEDYRVDKVPLIVPVTLIKHHIDAHLLDHINLQGYLSPYPDSLGLRNAL